MSSKAAYLHGSFGSGKSHFMAILHLLLQENAKGRSIRELARVVAKHSSWIEGKRFLLVPYHMIGARSMESAILGHYAEHVRKLHPESRVPGVYLAEGIFDTARKLREQMGEEKFFEADRRHKRPSCHNGRSRTPGTRALYVARTATSRLNG